MTAPSVDRSWWRGESESRDELESSVIIYLNVTNHNVPNTGFFVHIVFFVLAGNSEIYSFQLLHWLDE